jgi:hypothetical protein
MTFNIILILLDMFYHSRAFLLTRVIPEQNYIRIANERDTHLSVPNRRRERSGRKLHHEYPRALCCRW